MTVFLRSGKTERNVLFLSLIAVAVWGEGWCEVGRTECSEADLKSAVICKGVQAIDSLLHRAFVQTNLLNV